MNYRAILLLCLLQTAFSFADTAESPEEKITKTIAASEADQQVVASENKKHTAATELEISLKTVPAYYQTEAIKGDRKVVMRRIAAPTELPNPKPKVSADRTQTIDLSQWKKPGMIEPVNIQLHATVYDDAHSKLILTYEKTRYTVWTNLNFKYLRLLGSFQAGERRYSYFGVTEQIDSEREAMISGLAGKSGFNYASRWESPPVPLGLEPEYIVVTENGNPVPNEVYRQLDDLLGHYMANEEKLRSGYENARQMQAARERYRKAHPEKPQDIVLNYSRMSNLAKSTPEE